ncbi:MAG TPA: hypothetical protein VGG33_12235, partial [Polyangia bacterium]
RPAKDPLATLLALREVVGAKIAGEADVVGDADSDFGQFDGGHTPGATTSAANAAMLTAGAAALLGQPGGALHRLLLPVLLGKGSGIEARLPYELEFR